MKTHDLVKKIAALQKQRKALMKAADAGKNHNGHRDADHLAVAIYHLEHAMHLINLVNN